MPPGRRHGGDAQVVETKTIGGRTASCVRASSSAIPENLRIGAALSRRDRAGSRETTTRRIAPSRFNRVTSHGRPRAAVRRHAPCYTGPPSRRSFAHFPTEATYDRPARSRRESARTGCSSVGRQARRLAGVLLGPGYVRRWRDVVLTAKNAAVVAWLTTPVMMPEPRSVRCVPRHCPRRPSRKDPRRRRIASTSVACGSSMRPRSRRRADGGSCS